MFFSLSLIFALLLDKIFGEAQRFHPLVGFGNLAHAIEKRLNHGSNKTLKGCLALSVLIVPITLIAAMLEQLTFSEPIAHLAFAAFVLYTAIGWQSLAEHARAITQPLSKGELSNARQALARIVSRDTESLSPNDISKATSESVLENGADAIFSAIFWFIVGGVPGLVLYRLSNTLDAMWGYKNERFLSFGWAAARLDDVLNYLPARLCALSYALCGKTLLALRCWRTQGKQWKSPNAGHVMAAGAGAIDTKLGGSASYGNNLEQRPELGPSQGNEASVSSVDNALALVNKSLLLWLLCLLMIEGSLLLCRIY